MKVRKSTVMEGCMGYGGAEIRLRGAWLRALGFWPGMQLQVSSTGAGKLELTVNSPVALTGEGFTRVMGD